MHGVGLDYRISEGVESTYTHGLLTIIILLLLGCGFFCSSGMVGS